jgi:hypothetical protein
MPQQESIGGALGTGLGKGISSGIDTLVNMKLDQIMRQGLLRGPSRKQKQVVPIEPMEVKEEIKEEKKKPAEFGKKLSMTSLRNMRKKFMARTAAGKVDVNRIMKEARQSGVDEESIEVLTSPVLTRNIVKYFLDKTSNNPKKARALAKSFGFEV